MCCHEHYGYGCHGWHYPERGYGPRWRYFEEPTPEERREYLEDEKKFLEQRLKEIEARIAETTK